MILFFKTNIEIFYITLKKYYDHDAGKIEG
jgi:hypothetical protein